MHRVINKLLATRAEVATLIKTLSVLGHLLEGKHLDAQQQDWSDCLVFKLVLLGVLDGHQVHNQLDVCLNHLLHIERVAFVCLLGLIFAWVFHKSSCLHDEVRSTNREKFGQVSELCEFFRSVGLTFCEHEEVHVVHVGEEANHCFISVKPV